MTRPTDTEPARDRRECPIMWPGCDGFWGGCWWYGPCSLPKDKRTPPAAPARTEE